jgi:hypothetical protein
VKFFTLRRLLNIVRQGEERLQLSHFRQMVERLGIVRLVEMADENMGSE